MPGFSWFLHLCVLISVLQCCQSLPDLNFTQALITLFGKDGVVLKEKELQEIIDFGKNVSNLPFLFGQKAKIHSQYPNKNLTRCLTAADIFEASNYSHVGPTELANLYPLILFTLTNPRCYVNPIQRTTSFSNPTTWVYGLVSVLVMKVIALVGIIAFPFMSENFYTMAISFLVALAISSLLGGTLFFFIPGALSLRNVPNYAVSYGDYVFYMICVAGGIYMFYLLEKLLRLLMERKERQYYNKDTTASRKAAYDLQGAESFGTKSRKISVTHAGDVTSFPKRDIVTKRDSRMHHEMASDVNIVANAKKQIPPIAYIVIIGDCVRNFIDGIAIGAAYSLDPLTGLSLSLAFVFEEIPTELGDVAILLSAGMSLCRAAMYHLGAAVFAFIGAIVGILVGDIQGSSTQLWIFSFSAGFFLYIALVDLMPEMNHALESQESRNIGRFKIFILQNLGLILGATITALLSYYSEHLHIDFGDDGH